MKLLAEKLRLPQQWQIIEKPVPDAQCWYAHPPSEEDVWLGCFLRFRNTSTAVEMRLNQMLSEPSHELNESEIFLSGAFRIGFPYELEDEPNCAYTADLAGFKVLVLERQWHHFSKKTYEVFIDPARNAVYSYHFFYAAPEEKFEKFWPIANNWLTEIAPTLVQ